MLAVLTQEVWKIAAEPLKSRVAPLAADAAWHLSQWDSMDDFLAVMQPQSVEASFFHAVTAVHRER